MPPSDVSMNLISLKPSLDEFTTPGTDWRLPENRIEAFTRVYNSRILAGDLDHWHVGRVITDYRKYNREQIAWYCLIFGFSYRNHFPMIVMQLFPEIWKTDIDELIEWSNNNWSRYNFAKDTKWNVRKFPLFIKSVQEWLNGETLSGKIDDILARTVDDNSDSNFDALNSELTSNLYGIGRMTSWLALQTMYELMGLNIDKWDLQLNQSGCWSQHMAMCYLFDHENDVTLRQLEADTDFLMTYMNARLPYHVDIFNVESVLCEYRKTMIGNKNGKIKEFTYWTSNELIYDFDKLHESWADYEQEIDWVPYSIAFQMKNLPLGYGYDPVYFQVNSKTGLNLNTHFYYSDEPNAYEVLDIPLPNQCHIPDKLFGLYIMGEMEYNRLYKIYNPTATVKYDNE